MTSCYINLLTTGWVLSAIKNATSSNRKKQFLANLVPNKEVQGWALEVGSLGLILSSVINQLCIFEQVIHLPEPILQNENNHHI